MTFQCQHFYFSFSNRITESIEVEPVPTDQLEASTHLSVGEWCFTQKKFFSPYGILSFGVLCPLLAAAALSVANAAHAHTSVTTLSDKNAAGLPRIIADNFLWFPSHACF